VARALPSAIGTIRDRDPAGARGPGAEPHHESRQGGWLRDVGCGRRRGGAEVLAETQTAILPLVPYLDTLRWVFTAVALGGIGVTI